MPFSSLALTPARFGRRLEQASPRIVRAFVTRIKEGVPGARTQSDRYVEDSLAEVLRDIAEFMKTDGAHEGMLASAWLAKEHGLQRARGRTYTLEDLRAEHRMLRGIILEVTAGKRRLAPRTKELFDRILDLTLSISTEVFVRNADREAGRADIERDVVQKEWANFTRIFRETPEMVCVLSGPEHRFEFVNEAHRRVLGFDATGMTVKEAQPESREIHGILDDVYRSGSTANLHEISVTLGDRARYFNLTYAAKRNLADEIDGVMIVGIEVTDQVLAREATRLQRSALELGLTGAPIDNVLAELVRTVEVHSGGKMKGAMFLWDAQARVFRLRAAPSFSLTMRAAYTTVNGEFAESVARAHGLALCWSSRFGEPTAGLFACFAVDACEPSASEMQSIEIAIRTAALILGRRRQEVELRLREDEIRAERQILFEMLEQMDIPTALHIGPDHTFVFTNHAFRETFGVGDILGRHCREIFPEGEAQGFIARLDEVFRTGVPFVGHELRFERVLPSGEKQEFFLDFTYAAKRDSNGDIEGVLATHVDATERVHALQRLETAKIAAESANDAKSAFLANMSHEIRTPLGAIMGFSELARQSGPVSEEVASYLAIVERNSTQVLRIIDDILDLAKVEAGRVSLEMIEVRLTEFLADFSSLMDFRARENGIEFHIVAETDLPERICTDPTRLRQILTNAVGNAIKFTQKGSVDLQICYVDGALEFGIADTGRGISDAQSRRLFNAFVQADASTTRKFGGTGLGLVLTKRLCQLLGGDYVLVRSQLGVGSKFKATVSASVPPGARIIPHAEVSFGASRPVTAPAARAGLTGVRVLLVEDSPDNQFLISLLLEREGASVAIANDGEEGVHAALAGDFEVVLMDIQMPKMDGHEAVRTLRAADYARPVIALTAHAMKEEAERAFSSGFSDFLSKPIQRRALIEMVGRLTEGAGQGSQPQRPQPSK